MSKAQMTKIGHDGRPLGEPTLAGFLDEKTNLMWAARDVSAQSMKFKDAEKAVREFRVANFDDWRLPTLDELETLRDVTRFDPAADPELGLKSAAYWTSTPDASSPADCAWIVSFGYGNADYYHQNDTAFVRAVRSARASQ